MTFTAQTIAQLIAALCTGSVFAAIAVDFLFYNRRKDVKTGRKSIVATGSMFGYFFLYFIVIMRQWGVFPVKSWVLGSCLMWGGVALIGLGTFINIWGRFLLKRNWANHIKIYENHMLITKGVYKVIRHPLYASIIMMLFGGSLLYHNYLSAILTVCIFIPFMTYRAGQEERLLMERFPKYTAYQKQAGMFLPRLRKG